MLDKNTKGLAGVVEVLIVVAVLAVVGFAVYTVTSSDDEPVASLSDLEALPADLTGLISVEEMKSLVSSELGDASVVGASLQVEDGVAVYELYLSNGSALYVNAVTGEVLDVEFDVSDDDDEVLPADLTTAVSLSEAIAKAQSEFPDKKVVKVEFELEDGALVFSVRFSDDSRVDVDATTGEINRVEDELLEDEDEDDQGEDSDDDDDSDDDNDKDDNSDSDDDDNSDDDDDDDDDDDSDDNEDDDDSDDGNSASGSN